MASLPSDSLPRAPAPDGDVAVAQRPQRQRIKPPPLYRVLLLNDDFTTMDFVVYALQSFFGKDLDEATRIMMEVHQKGRGTAGVYPFAIAETKVAQVVHAARQQGHPLQCLCEPLE